MVIITKMATTTQTGQHSENEAGNAGVKLAAFTNKADISETLENLKSELVRLDKLYTMNNSSRNYRAMLAIFTTNSWFTETPIFVNDYQFNEALQALRCLYEHILENNQCHHHLNHLHCLLSKFWQESKYDRCTLERNNLLVDLLKIVKSHQDGRTYKTEISIFVDAMTIYRQNIFNFIKIKEGLTAENKSKRKKRRTRKFSKLFQY